MILKWHLRSILCVIIISSCTNTGRKDETTSMSPENEAKAAKTQSSSVEEDCVFNNDYQGLTTKWLKELRKDNFVWMPDVNRAVVVEGSDSIFVSKGGCTHFGLKVELKISNDQHSLLDSTFWIERTLRLADEFGMEHYSKVIRSKSLKKVQVSSTKVWYEVDDDDGGDNLYYDGIEITVERSASRIDISQYYY